MKKHLIFTLSMSLMFVVLMMPIFASKDISVYYDGVEIEFDVKPQIIDGRTMVPMRAIFEKLGAVVYWDNNTRTAIAQKGNVNVSIAIDDTILYKNSEPVTLDVPAQLKNGRTLVPLRAVSEAFDCDVQWDGNTQTVNISTDRSLALKKEAINKLIDWVNNNSNNSLPPDGHKAFQYKQGNSKIDIIPNVGGKNLNINYLVSDNNETVSVCIWLLNARFGGSYMDNVTKTSNHAEGDIINENSSNSLNLNCDWYTGTYNGDKGKVLEKYKNSVNATLKLFDSFLKTNYVGISLEDFGLNFDLSSVILPKDLTQQEIAFEKTKEILLYYQEKTNIDSAEVVKTLEDSNGSTQYSMLYDDEEDVIRLTNTRIYKGSYTRTSIELTPLNQMCKGSFSFFYPENKSNTPDLEATYIIDAKTFGENSNINFEIVNGDKATANSFEEIAKFMILDLLEYFNVVFPMIDFGFNLK